MRMKKDERNTERRKEDELALPWGNSISTFDPEGALNAASHLKPGGSGSLLSSLWCDLICFQDI